MSKHWSQALVKLGACSEAIEYAESQSDFQTAWNNCERGDWMLWLAAKLPAQVTRQQLVFTTCQCARLALPYTKDARVLHCIEVTEAWTRGKATIEQINTARSAYAAYAAYAAAYAAVYAAADAAYVAADTAAYAAYATVYAAIYAAADTAADALHAAADAAYATADTVAYAAVYAAVYAADTAARSNILKQCADIVRSQITLTLKGGK